MGGHLLLHFLSRAPLPAESNVPGWTITFARPLAITIATLLAVGLAALSYALQEGGQIGLHKGLIHSVMRTTRNQRSRRLVWQHVALILRIGPTHPALYRRWVSRGFPRIRHALSALR